MSIKRSGLAGSSWNSPDHGFGHAIEQVGGHRGTGAGIQRLAPAQQALLADHGDLDAALDSVHVLEAAVMRDVGRLAGPRRDGAEARDHHKAITVGLCLERRAIGQQRGDAGAVVLRQRHVGVDKMQELAVHRFDVGVDLLEGGEQALLAKGGKRQCTGEAREMRHGLSGREGRR
ncbi:hypothetical protein OR16_26678 [Cupriavidus basilensis OR16]|uniref:Uncharacterized protein n=1 Tax=Cupriavidus basilensis OR16 TaxID=1127483 RepID=H1SB14_9BURK|nr:hypothetical protein OR16_26678 [Cupriavidus basilensis OR16]